MSCQLVIKMLAMFLCIDIKYSRCVYSNITFHQCVNKLSIYFDSPLRKYVFDFGWIKRFK